MPILAKMWMLGGESDDKHPCYKHEGNRTEYQKLATAGRIVCCKPSADIRILDSAGHLQVAEGYGTADGRQFSYTGLGIQYRYQ